MDATMSDAVQVPLERGWRVEGVVLDAARRPVPRAVVELEGHEWGPGNARTTADDDGRFRFLRLTVDPVRLTAKAEGTASEPLDVQPARTDVKPVELVVRQTEARITGRVRTHDGRAAPQTRVMLHRSERTWVFMPDAVVAVAVTAPDGTFVFDDVVPTTWGLVADHESEGVAAQRPVTVDAPIELVLSGRGSIEGAVVGATGRCEVKAEQRERFAVVERRFDGGHFRVDDLIAGRWQVTVRAGERSASAAVVVPPGGSATVELQVR